MNDCMYIITNDKKDFLNEFVLLGSEVDKPSKILIKTSNAVEYIELDI